MSTEFDQMDNGDWLRYWSIEGQKQLERNQKLIEAFRKEKDRKSTRLNSSHVSESRMPSSA